MYLGDALGRAATVIYIPSGKPPLVFAVNEVCVKPSTRETDRDTLQQAELSATHPYDSFSFSRASRLGAERISLEQFQVDLIHKNKEDEIRKYPWPL